MIGLFYRVSLLGQCGISEMRRRISERAPWLDGMAGLAHSFLLLDAQEPSCAALHLWLDEKAALRFIDGPLFDGLARRFGRPAISLLLPRRVALPPFEAHDAWLSERALAPLPGRDSSARIELVDPAEGRILSLGFTADAPGRQVEIAYHARGAGSSLPRDAIGFLFL